MQILQYKKVFFKDIMVDTVLTHLGFVCALGNSLNEIITNAVDGNVPGFCIDSTEITNRKVPFYQVTIKKNKKIRCYQLIDIILKQLKPELDQLFKKYKPNEIGIVLGTTNTGIHEAQYHIDQWITENRRPKDFSLEEIELGSPALYLQKKLKSTGPAYVISTACSSSAKVFQTAQRLIDTGICEVVLVGGVDSHCKFALNGFSALSALSENKVLPFSKNRTGINLGEGAAIFIMEKGKNGIGIKGIGETSDAYDLTHPDPNGNGAERSMKLAMNSAHLNKNDIDYINMHGTGTIANDLMEGRAINRIFGTNTLCASTKSLTGHTLGAAGAVEAALSWLMLKHQCIIPHFYDGEYDESIPKLNLAKASEKIKLQNILSNSFAFGGSNASIIMGVINK